MSLMSKFILEGPSYSLAFCVWHIMLHLVISAFFSVAFSCPGRDWAESFAEAGTSEKGGRCFVLTSASCRNPSRDSGGGPGTPYEFYKVLGQRTLALFPSLQEYTQHRLLTYVVKRGSSWSMFLGGSGLGLAVPRGLDLW